MKRVGQPYVLFMTIAVIAIMSMTSPPRTSADTPSPNYPPNAVVVSAENSPFGRVLFTVNHRALYLFSFDAVGTKNTPAGSSCSGDCATEWPPLMAPGANGPFNAQGGVQSSHLGTIQRTDPAGFQVTYFGFPLYMFAEDTAPRQTNGENVAAFDGIWHLLNPMGQPDAGRATVSLELSDNGPVLDTPTAFSTHRSLYQLTTDPAGTATCLDACARIWPPLLTTDKPATGSGVLQTALGTLSRPDHTRQVTYFGRPLYLFAFDMDAAAPSGLTNGENLVDQFVSGVWRTTAPSGTPDAGPVMVTSESSTMGTILAYQSSSARTPGPFTLYAFNGDTSDTSNCTGDCARIWPPLITNAPPAAATGSGVDGSHLGTILRSDGTFQVTYFGHPLYLFADGFTGTAGEGVGGFQVVSLSGAPH